jgi:hypothetical protein
LTGAGDDIQDVGDLSLIWKAIVCGGFDTEDLVTLGLIVTLPTGQKLATPQGDIDSVLIQPWVGYYYTVKNFYLQGFTGAVIPTESRDTGFTYTSLTLGRYFYQSRKANPWISLVAGQLEGHFSTPFERPKDDRPIVINTMTYGNAVLHVGFGDKSLLTVGIGGPVGGFRPYQYAGSAMLSLFF